MTDGRCTSRWRTRPRGRVAPARRRGLRRGERVRASMCMCRSAPAAAATATSTPTRPASWAAGASREEYADTVLAELRAGPPDDQPRQRWTRCSSAAARPRCSTPTTWAGSWTASTAPGGSPPTPRSPPRPTPSRSRPTICAGCGGTASPGSRSACSRPARRCCASSTAGTPPGGRREAAVEAREAGFEHVNLDLIYGTPGETADDFAASLAAVVGAGRRPRQRLLPDRRGRHPDGRPDAARRAPVPVGRRRRRPLPGRRGRARRGGLRLVRGLQLGHLGGRRAAGTTCSTGPAPTGGASGPGAHSHVGGVRWWNVKHPIAYAKRLAGGVSPGQARELLTRRGPPRRGRDAAGAAARRPPAGPGRRGWRREAGAGRRPAGAGRVRPGAAGADPARPAARRRRDP